MVAQVAGLFPSFQQISGPCGTVVTGRDLTAFVREEFSNNAGAPLVARAGGGQANATPCPNAINYVATVATAANSLMLPPAIPGRSVTIINHGANDAQVFGVPNNPNNNGAPDTISAHGTTTQAGAAVGVDQPTATVGTYVCFNAGQWKQILSV